MRANEVVAVLAILFEVYPRRVGSGDRDKTIAVWSMALAEADAKQILNAAVAWVRANKPHPPSPGELMAFAEVDDESSASEAWGHVLRQIHAVGADGEPDLSERESRAVRACGGEWSIMCRNLQTSQLPALRARFIEAYNTIGERMDRQEMIADADALLALARPLARQYALDYEEGRKSGR